jgi:hypothetical protein
MWLTLFVVLCAVFVIYAVQAEARRARERVAKLEKLLVGKHEAWRGERWARINAEVTLDDLDWERKHGFSAPLASPYRPWGLRSPQAPLDW